MEMNIDCSSWLWLDRAILYSQGMFYDQFIEIFFHCCPLTLVVKDSDDAEPHFEFLIIVFRMENRMESVRPAGQQSQPIPNENPPPWQIDL